ncbi:MAG: head GIN domain-containing protein, partial [Usitatibacteraceae bacterium]
MQTTHRLSFFFRPLLLAASFGLSALAPSCLVWAWGNSVAGSGTVKTETRSVGGFTGVSLSVPGKATLVQGSSEGVTIETDDNILPLIETVVEEGKLKIRFKDRNTTVKTKTLRMTINVKSIESIAVAGSTDVHVAKLQASKLKISIAGAGDAFITTLDADTLNISIAGSGNFAAGGKANSVIGKIAGSGDIRIENLVANTVKLSIAGSGDAKVWAKESLTVSVAGSG